MTTPLMQCLELPCGLKLSNRVVKSALSEDLATETHSVSDDLLRLYQCFGESGAGLIIAGNLEVDCRYLSSRRDLAFNGGKEDFKRLSELASVIRRCGSCAFIQISHPGVCAQSEMRAVGPSAIRRREARQSLGVANSARKLTAVEVDGVVQRFASVAAAMKAAGFDGVIVDAGRNSLIGQFLSPSFNRRVDDWGGSSFARQRFLLEIVRECRKAISKDFALGVQIDPSALSPELSDWLSFEGIDLLEIRPVSPKVGEHIPFLDQIRCIRDRSRVPLLITEGFEAIEEMEDALTSHRFDLIGVSAWLSQDPHLLEKLSNGSDVELQQHSGASGLIRWLGRLLGSELLLEQAKLKVYRTAVKRISRGDASK